MKASDVLNRVIDLSLGQNDVSEEERAKFLEYLKLALIDFYTRTASMDDQRYKVYTQDNIDEQSDIVLTDANGDPIPILYIEKVRTPTFAFSKMITWPQMQERKFLNQNEEPVYCFRDNMITFYSKGHTPYSVFISYVPVLQLVLTEETDLSSFMRLQWHSLLIYGTLYYIYQDMDGFKSSVKESIAATEWKTGLSNCVASLFNASRSRFNALTSRHIPRGL